MNYFNNASLGKKIAAICAVSVLAVFLSGSIVTSIYLGGKIYEESIAELSAKTKIIVSMMEVLDESTKVSADRMSSLFIHDVAGTAVVNPSNTIKIGTADTPEMRIGGKIVNLNTEVVDRFTKTSGGTVATIFARKGDDFYRVTTSLKKEDGTRAMGTALDHAHPAYQILLNGGTYLGQAMLFGKYYMTKYTPIKDASGKTIGSYFVGVDITSEMNKMMTAIKSLKIGETGYFFAINGKGDVKIHPSLEGKNILNSKDADGKEIFKDIIAKKNGAIFYNWKDPGAMISHGKTTYFDYVKDWDWYICGSTFDSELKAGATRARNALIVLALLGSMIVSAIIFWAVNKRLAGLKTLSEKVQAISKGDLAVKIEAQSNDEVGRISSEWPK